MGSIATVHSGYMAGPMSVINRPQMNATGNPISMTNPATGTASKLVTNETAGADENISNEIGITPNWAPSVVASGSFIHFGPCRNFFNHGDTKINPHVASEDIHMPMENTRSGSTARRTTTVYSNALRAGRSRPRANAIADIAAIIVARSTEGSARVTTTNQLRRNSVSPRRHHVRARLMYTPNTVSTKATF